MRLSRYFLPILRDNPKEAEIVSHRLMLRAGMVRQEAAGIYAWLPLGLRVLDKDTELKGKSKNAPLFIMISDGQSWSGEVATALKAADFDLQIYYTDPDAAMTVRASFDWCSRFRNCV